jgi:hypothetical protein
MNLQQAGAQPFEPAQPVRRMNRPVGRFTSSTPTTAMAESTAKSPPLSRGNSQRYKLRGLFGAQGVHYVYAGCAGCWEHGRYYCGG